MSVFSTLIKHKFKVLIIAISTLLVVICVGVPEILLHKRYRRFGPLHEERMDLGSHAIGIWSVHLYTHDELPYPIVSEPTPLSNLVHKYQAFSDIRDYRSDRIMYISDGEVFLLIGNGPDREFQIRPPSDSMNNMPEGPFSHIFDTIPYDPTNGLLSVGDIILYSNQDREEIMDLLDREEQYFFDNNRYHN